MFRLHYKIIIIGMLIANPALAKDYYIGPWDTSGRGPCKLIPFDCKTPPSGCTHTMDVGDTIIHACDENPGSGYTQITKSNATAIIKDRLIDKSDPDGKKGQKPLIPKSGQVGFSFADIKYSEQFSMNSSYGDKIKKLFQNDYKNIANESGEHVARKQLYLWGQQYGVDKPEDMFIPNDMPKKSPLKPQTSFTESFAGTSDTFGGDCTWTEVSGDWDNVSDQGDLATTTGNRSARCDSDVSSADHTTTVDVAVLTKASGEVGVGAAVRFSASANTNYACMIYWDVGNKYKGFAEVTAGSYAFPVLNTGATFTAPFELKCDISGSDLELFLDSVSVETWSDSSITGNTRGGFYGHNSGSADFKVDDWIIDDGVGGGGGSRRMYLVIT